jgi:ABC-2 type transport system ATP-binding protein
MIQASGATTARARSQTLLVADKLHKSYGPRLALQGLSFTLEAGHVLGFLGPNGAGKTTAIRILTTMLEPTSGSFSVDGIDSQRPNEIRRKIGVLPEHLGFPKRNTGLEYLTYFAQLYGQTASEAQATARELLEEVGMTARARSLLGTYSHGMQQRIGIARALVNSPLVVFLDEPTLGLDPRGQQELLALIQRIARERGTGVILCSHMLSEIEGICDDVVIMRGGQIVAKGSVDELIRGTKQHVVRIFVPPSAVAQAQGILTVQPGVLQVTPPGDSGGALRVELDEPDVITGDEFRARNRLLEALIRADIPIIGFETEGGRLQDVFLQLTEEGTR